MVPTSLLRLAVLTAVVAPALSAAAGQGDGAGQPKAVIELFTSQGCSSCPPADETLAALAREPGVLTLAYHVDYWNYLGWADTLSSPENTARQRSYAASFSARTVYTPQAVINGLREMPGQDQASLSKAITGMATKGAGLTVPLKASFDKGTITVTVPDGNAEADVLVLTVAPSVTVDVKRGENRGRKLTYVNSVTNIEKLGHWSGKAVSLSMTPKAGADASAAYTVLLQTAEAGTSATDRPGAIIGAATLEPALVANGK